MSNTTTFISVMCPASAATSMSPYLARRASGAFSPALSMVSVGGHIAGGSSIETDRTIQTGQAIETGRDRTGLPATTGANDTKRLLHLIGSRSG
jgi:hypothetical protein